MWSWISSHGTPGGTRPMAGDSLSSYSTSSSTALLLPVCPLHPTVTGPARSGQESRSATVCRRLAFLVRAGSDPGPGDRHGGRPEMPAKKTATESGGFTADERAAMKARAAELRAEGKKGAKKA